MNEFESLDMEWYHRFTARSLRRLTIERKRRTFMIKDLDEECWVGREMVEEFARTLVSRGLLSLNPDIDKYTVTMPREQGVKQ